MSDPARIHRICQAALALPPSHRAAFLDGACAQDQELRAAVDQQLTEFDATQTFAEVGPAETGLASGDVLGKRFRIERFLGAGGMGAVYAAVDLELGGLVALKTLHPRLAADQQYVQRFRREVQLARQVTHPNICRVFDLGIDERPGGPVLFLTMEYLDGWTLARRLQLSGPLGQDCLPIARDLVAGLGALHERGILHRDLKPANVMVVTSETGVQRAVIMDFGLAREARTGTGEVLTEARQMIGTPKYMSPEQLHGHPATRQADIYSLGLILFEASEGVLPPLGPDADSRTPPSLKGGTLGSAIARCLAWDPAGRPRSVEEVAAMLPTTPSAIAPAAAAPKRAFGPLAAAAGAVVLSLAGAGAWWMSRNTPAPPPLLERRLVAVLPFQAIDEDRELRALSDGMAEMLTSKLTQIEGLQKSFSVVPASEIRGRGIDSVERARKQYGAHLAITGSIQRLGASMQFTANLVDTNGPRQLKSTSFDATPGDLKALRDGVIGRVLAMLDQPADPRTEQALAFRETTRATAYFDYLEGRGYLHRFDVSGNVDRAIESLQKALRADPGYALAHAALGEAYWRKARATNETSWSDRAIASARKAVELGGNLAIPLVNLGEILSQHGDRREAVERFRQALQTEPANAGAHRGLGRTYAALGLLKEAEESYLQAVRLRPTDWYAHNLLGVFYMENGKLDQAEAAWKQARELTPDNDYPHRNLGMLLINRGQFDEARQNFERAQAIRPSFLGHIGLGDVLYYTGQAAAAIPHFEAAIQLEPNNYVGWGMLGDAWAQTGQGRAKAMEAYAEAIARCQRRLAVSPAPIARAAMACFHAKRAEKAKAFEILAPLADQPSLDLDTRYRIAMTHEVAGERALAVQEMSALLRDGYRPARLRAEPYLKGLVADPVFAPVLARYR